MGADDKLNRLAYWWYIATVMTIIPADVGESQN